MARKSAEIEIQPEHLPRLKLFLLAGQSNMSGRGAVDDGDRMPQPGIVAMDADGRWVCRGEPIHFDKDIAGVGIGYAFARLMIQADPSGMVGLVPCAVGGSEIARWVPEGDLFETAVQRMVRAQDFGTLCGILWHQGENDSMDAARAAAYPDKLRLMADGLRSRLNMPKVPIVLGELGRFLTRRPDGRYSFADQINHHLHRFSDLDKNSAVVSSEGAVSIGDDLHFDASSLKMLGARYFEAFRPLSVPAISTEERYANRSRSESA